MHALWLLLVLALVLMLGGRANAQPGQPMLDPVSQAVQREAQKVGDFLEGPQYRSWPVNPALDCTQIYEEMVRLTPYTYNYKPDFYDDPRNGAIGALGFAFTPIFYAWSYTALDRYSEQRKISDTGQRIDALRRASARQDCWVRD
jgi:hypothetical protein